MEQTVLIDMKQSFFASTSSFPEQQVVSNNTVIESIINCSITCMLRTLALGFNPNLIHRFSDCVRVFTASNVHDNVKDFSQDEIFLSRRPQGSFHNRSFCPTTVWFSFIHERSLSTWINCWTTEIVRYLFWFCCRKTSSIFWLCKRSTQRLSFAQALTSM